jgi:kumamolisin
LKHLVLRSSLAAAVLLLSFSFSAYATDNNGRSKGHVMIPQSSVQKPQDIGQTARTHLRVFVPAEGFLGKAVQPSELPPFPGLLFETPASLGCVYRLVPHPVRGCNPNVTTENPSGGAGAIALVEAFDNATAASDLATFSAQFGLPAANITVVFANGARPGNDPTGGFEIESALDIEWAHAMAPHAKIFLVEAANNNLVNLFNAVTVASNLVSANGGGEVSMSFGSGEFSQETLFDSIFTTPNVVYFASAGDSPGPEYPSASPNVISAGGTTVSRNTTTGDFILEDTWQDAGGGPSQFEPRPAFQDRVRHIVGDSRGTPDFSFDSNPTTGVWVFDSNPVLGAGWFVVGGTSVASPSLAGIVNAAGGFRASSQAENNELYRHISEGDVFRDITFGNCGLSGGDFAMNGWDFCTGVGTTQGLRDK